MRVHRPLLAATGIVAAGALLTGCGARPAAAVPAPTATAPAVSTATVTEEQASRIVHRIAAVVERSDAKRDDALLATRVAGPAYDLRDAAYRIRKKDKKATLPQHIPGADATLGLILPQASHTWPRTLFAIVESGEDPKAPPLALSMVQDDPRADYKVHYSMAIVRDAVLPDLPAATIGASRLDASTTLLRVPPAQLAADYGLLLRKPDAEAAQVFDTADDELAAGVGRKAKDKAVKRLGSTAKISFSDLDVDPGSVVALSTADSGALVSVELKEKWTVKPKQAGVSVKPSGGTPILAGITSTTKGVASVYGYQLLFAVPSAGSKKPVVLLGYAQGLVSAKEL